MQHDITKFKAPKLAKNSLLISFEGIEGAGKSTQIHNLKTHLEKKNYSVTLVREPGGTLFGEKLREAMLKSEKKIHPLAEAHLFASARAQLLHEVTLPLLSKENQVVIYDRYLDSSLAYQGEAGELGLSTILRIHEDAPLNTIPHLTFYLKISLELSYERQAKRNQAKDYFESKKEDFYKGLIRGYEKAATIFPDRIAVIDASKNEQEVSGLVIKAFDQFYENRFEK